MADREYLPETEQERVLLAGQALQALKWLQANEDILEELESRDDLPTVAASESAALLGLPRHVVIAAAANLIDEGMAHMRGDDA